MTPKQAGSFPLIAFVGVGTMAEAMVECALKGGWPRDRLILTHRRADRRAELAQRFGGEVGEDNLAAVKEADAAVVGVRPQELEAVLNALMGGFGPGKTLISIAAGMTVEWLRARLPKGMKVIRVTPPPTAWVGAGVTLMSADADVDAEERRFVERLVVSTCDRIEWIPDDLMEPITAMALGLTPYTCMMLQTLIATGIEQGIEPEFARRMVMDGAQATARLFREGGFTPEQVIDMVATREGLTWCALHTMEAHGVQPGIRAGARAMTGRSYELRGEPIPKEYQGFKR